MDLHILKSLGERKRAASSAARSFLQGENNINLEFVNQYFGLESCKLNRCKDVGLTEIFSLEEQRLAKRFGQRVSETIAKVQGSGMAAFAVIGKGLPGDKCLLLGDGLDSNSRLPDEGVPLLDCAVAAASFHNRGHLHKIRR